MDGALATELETRFKYNLDNVLWSASLLMDENINKIKEIHRSYLDSGADIIITSSYQATFEGFKEMGLNHKKSIQSFKSSIRIAKESIEEYCKENNLNPQEKPLVAASMVKKKRKKKFNKKKNFCSKGFLWSTSTWWC